MTQRNTPDSSAQGSNAAARASALTALLADAPEATDHEAVREYVHQLAKTGVAVLLVYPSSKEPADMRTPQKRRADDKAAQHAARAAGQRGWEQVRSPAGLALATTDTDVLDRYLDRYIRHFSKWVNADGQPVGWSEKAEDAGLITTVEPVKVNLAVETGRSGLVVIDCDTPEQMMRWYETAEIDVETMVGADPQVNVAPTVVTPGHVGSSGDADDPGTWAHSSGGHFWFVVPENVTLPSGPEHMGAMTWGGDDGFAVLWDRRYVLIPPSVRSEGVYTAPGRAYELMSWLGEAIAKAGENRAERAAKRSAERADRPSDSDLAQRIDAWAEATSWASILEPLGWVPAPRPDGCGCEIWTAPGDHASPKSATAHGAVCTAGRYSDRNAPMHIWTTGPIAPFDAKAVSTTGGYRNLTKLQAVAAGYYDNDEGAAMDALGLTDSNGLAVDDDLPADYGKAALPEVDGTATGNQGGNAGRALRITWACEIEPEPVDWLWVDIAAQNTPGLTPDGTTAPDPHMIADIACVAPGRTWSPPEVETDGRIACGMVSIAAGREGSGKSSFGIWLAAKITRGTLPGKHYGVPKRVYYLATEDSWKHTLVPRLIAAGADLTMVARIEVAVNECATVTLSLPEDVDLLTQSITDNGVALVVIDPLMSTMSAGLDTNGTRDVRTALEPLAAMADTTGAAVVALAHFNKATGLDSLTRITGSGAFKDVARAVMVFAVGTDGERVFSQPKNSVGRNDLPSLNYEVNGAVVETAKGKAATACFTFTGVADSTVDDSLGNEHRPGRAGGGASPVERFIADYIASHADPDTDDGGVPAADVIAAGAEAGYSERQIKDARSRVTDPVVTTQRVGFGKGSYMVWKAAS